jgi:DNA-binding GntR family transcriptional regulator
MTVYFVWSFMKPARSRRRPIGKHGGDGVAGAFAYRRLHALIVEGVLAPGSPLIEGDVCARLGVSRTPVRAALLRLEQEGLVRGPTAGRGGRAIVSPLTAGDLREIFLMIGALEAIAVRGAAALDPPDRAAMAAALDDENHALRAAIAERPPDLIAGLRHHLGFHNQFLSAKAGMRVCGELITLAAQAVRYERLYSAAMVYAIDEFVTAHERIITAIRAGDADEAERATAADWRLSSEHYAALVTALGERGNW